jgi:hypothetical protein
VPAERERYLTVPVDAMRERFLRAVQSGELTADQVALRVGWVRRRNGQIAGDGTEVARALGVRPRTNSNRNWSGYARTIRYDRAVMLARALGMEPWEAGV